MSPKPDLPRDPLLAARLADVGYDVAGVVAALLCVPALPLLVVRGYWRGASERLGRLPDGVCELPAAPLWLHAASVGEARAAAPLVARLRERCPALPIVVSTTTVTGRSVVREDLQPDVATLLPLDLLRIVDRAFRRLRPRCLVLVETELWPGLLRAAHRVEAPIVMVSGRLSDRALRRYRWGGALFRAAVGRVAAFGMQTAADAERIVALGADAERVRVTGSLKASRQPAPVTPPPVSGLEDRPVLIAASTQPGEEEFVLEACAGLWRIHPDALLLIAPRRPERFGMVERLVAETGLRYQRRSKMNGAVARDAQVLLLDTVGELVRFFPAARGVFVGGTVAPLGGHNVLEPATFGKPVAFGPNVENVADAAQALCAAGGGVVVRQPGELQDYWKLLLERGEEAEAAGARARAVVVAGADVIEDTWAMLAPYLEVSR